MRSLHVWLIGMIVGLLLLTMQGCASTGLYQMSDNWCDDHPSATQARCPEHIPSQSWDQANLKKNDVGCPTAIFVAPGGNLEQCIPLKVWEHTEPAKAAPAEFKTMDEAAVHAEAAIYAKSHWYEYCGIIEKLPDGKYGVAEPDTLIHGTNSECDEDPEDYEYPIVATYHNHPCLKNAIPSVFSPADLESMRTTNRPGYIADFCTGQVHKWTPGDAYLGPDAMIKLGASPLAVMLGHVQLAAGAIVGGFSVDGQVLQ